MSAHALLITFRHLGVQDLIQLKVIVIIHEAKIKKRPLFEFVPYISAEIHSIEMYILKYILGGIHSFFNC